MGMRRRGISVRPVVKLGSESESDQRPGNMPPKAICCVQLRLYSEDYLSALNENRILKGIVNGAGTRFD